MPHANHQGSLQLCISKSSEKKDVAWRQDTGWWEFGKFSSDFFFEVGNKFSAESEVGEKDHLEV